MILFEVIGDRQKKPKLTCHGSMLNFALDGRTLYDMVSYKFNVPKGLIKTESIFCGHFNFPISFLISFSLKLKKRTPLQI